MDYRNRRLLDTITIYNWQTFRINFSVQNLLLNVCLSNWKWRFKVLTSLMYFFHLQTGLNSNYTGPLESVWHIYSNFSARNHRHSIQATQQTEPLEIFFLFHLFCQARQAFNLENWSSYIELLTVLLQFLTSQNSVYGPFTFYIDNLSF